MKHRFSTLILTIIFTFGTNSSASQSSDVDDTLVPLSSKEADAIIQEEAKAKADEKARKRAFLLDQSKFQVIEQTEAFVGKDKITLNRVRPPLLEQPVLESEVTEILQPQRQLSEAELEQMFSEYSQKKQRMLMLSATVYDRKLTKLQWYHEGQQYVAWSNVDFNYLRPLTEIETQEANYSFLLGIGNESTEKIKESIRLAKEKGVKIYDEWPIPELPDFARDSPEYFVIASNDSAERPAGAYIPIDALHDYYAENEERLKIQYQRSEALSEARQRYKDQHPEEPDDVIINFWPGRGSVYQESNTQ